MMKLEDMINTIQLGDCYELIKDIPNKSIDLVYIDIPYLINGMIKKDGTSRELGGFTKDSKSRKAGRNKSYKQIGQISNGIDYSILDELYLVEYRKKKIKYEITVKEAEDENRLVI